MRLIYITLLQLSYNGSPAETESEVIQSLFCVFQAVHWLEKSSYVTVCKNQPEQWLQN